MLLDDAKDGGQAETGSFARLLRGEERLEDARQILRRNAGSSVRDAQADISSGPCIRYRTRLILSVTFFRGFNEELPTVGHGVAGVDHEVHEHLVEQPGVGAGHQGALMRIELQADVRA